MEAQLMIRAPIPQAIVAAVVERSEAEARAKWGTEHGTVDGFIFKGPSVDAFYDDTAASEALSSGSRKAETQLDATAAKIGLKPVAPEILYGFSGTRGFWHFWYQRRYS